jgi:DNA repair protein RecN (Recombination protein N)
MIERFYLKNHLSFDEATLEFNKNLIIFSGPSGAGKSILMESLLTLFGLKDCDAKVIEATIDHKVDLTSVGIEEDEPNIFKMTKEKSARYFINNQQISKKNIKTLSKNFINYLTLREFSEFENENLLLLLDAIYSQKDKKHQIILDEYQETYKNLKQSEKELNQIIEQEKKIIELKEFTTYEIDKIESINPTINEYEELLIQKKELSKKEKIEESINSASKIFEFENRVSEALALLDEDSNFFDESFNNLKIIFENATDRLEELNTLDIEQMLQRLEDLSSLKNKYGSIEAALQYLQEKKIDLKKYENIEFEKSELAHKVQTLNEKIEKLAKKLTLNRKKSQEILKQRVEYYLELLYLQGIEFKLSPTQPHEKGADEISVKLQQTQLNKISSGELNRLRLSLLAASSEFIQSNGGVLILDEIDANLSGKESMSIAKVLKVLSKNYQVFAISHQPQLSSYADMHFLIYKKNGKSSVKLLQHDEKIKELSRMISGDKISDEAIKFAQSLLEGEKQ